DKSGQEKGDQGEKGNEKGKQSDKGDKQGGGSGKAPQDASKGLKEMEKGSKMSSSSSLSSRLSGGTGVLHRVGPVLKWILVGVLVVVVLVALFRGGLGWLANFSDWAKRLLQAWRNFWANLFGRRQAGAEEGEEEEVGPPRQPQRPFS